MSLRGAEAITMKCQSVEAVRESLQKIWETCLPKRKRGKPANHYFVPDLNRPMVLRRWKEDSAETKLLQLRRLDGPNLQGNQATSSPPTAFEVLRWRSSQRSRRWRPEGQPFADGR